jgi:hypothetical protein
MKPNSRFGAHAKSTSVRMRDVEPNPDGNREERRAAKKAPRCPAHGVARCALCSLNGPVCTECTYYAETGMHWDTCINRMRS